ncbi:MPS2 (YGL075C) and CSM4 (YPL200W) [Zygosaccharomyces parabailii]|nr:MPS2 (YGL075C) and CSM4 (YPL200W) [Zygosaccharomyces parabailii]CDH17948.1 probable Monopolar spindle protein 2 [Zygosaccharomyces bailii ISA1307]
MDLDKSSSSIVLDLAWSDVDRKNQDFIYAKDFPALIRSIEKILNRGKPEELPLLSNTGKSVIDTFAKEKEFFKIYRDEFKEIFHGLVGKTFKDAIEMANVPEQVSAGSVLQDTQPSKPQEAVKSSKSSPRKANCLLRNLENRLSTMKEELKFKDEILAEKDRELIQLTRKLGEYKDKYEFVQRQFNFYKDHGESPKRSSSESSNMEQNASTKHEFIISELKRKLQEQTLAISTLREQLHRSEGAGAFYSKSAKDMNLNDWSKAMTAFLLLTSLVILLCGGLLWLMSGSDDSTSFAQPSWWEKNGVLSRIGWFIRDWSTNSVDYVDFEPSSDAYDRIMGIRRM